MIIDVKNMKGEKVQEVELPASIFEAPILVDLMHQAYVRQLANARVGTHETKTRHEVSGGGRKPFKQKGTGRARQGSIRAAQWTGGGMIFAPTPRDYSFKMNKKERRAALKSALTSKVQDSSIIVLDSLKFDGIKTKNMTKVLNNLKAENALVVTKTPLDAFCSLRAPMNCCISGL